MVGFAAVQGDVFSGFVGGDGEGEFGGTEMIDLQVGHLACFPAASSGTLKVFWQPVHINSIDMDDPMVGFPLRSAAPIGETRHRSV